MRQRFIVLGSVLFVSGMTVGVGLTGRFLTQAESEAAPPVAAKPVQRIEQPALKKQLNGSSLPTFADVAEASIPAVANISSRQVVRQRSLFNNDPFFRYFFQDSRGFSGYRERPSLGSGVIVRSDGYILTNAHVIGRQTAGVTVTLADNREYEAELIGRDEMTDIALLRIGVNDLPTMSWGDSSSLRIAEWVLAVGNPFQLNQTVTLGIVSAVGRDNLGVARYEDFIQTDAAINPGNSGGALINAHGELVGINTAIFSDSGGSQGVGFAVPSNLARRVMNELITYGEVRRGSFGYVDVRTLNPQLAQELGAPTARGVVVWRIHQESAAARAGLEPGDIIVAFNGSPLEDGSDYSRLLSDAEIGSSVTLEVVRDGQHIDFIVLVSQSRPNEGTRR
jgi:Do/DeqQ family serine protease